MLSIINNPGNLNLLDMTVILVIGVSIYIGYRKGLIRTLYSLCAVFIALFLSNKLYPYVGNALRVGGLYESLQKSIVKNMNLQQLVSETIHTNANELFSNLPLPNFMIEKLTLLNTPEMYEKLGVSTIENYIGGYIADIFVNLISMAIVFVAVIILMKVITISLDIIAKLPIIKGFNAFGGLFAGLVAGLLYVWIALGLYTLFFVNPNSNSVAVLQDSVIALKLYENNLVFNFILGFFA